VGLTLWMRYVQGEEYTEAKSLFRGKFSRASSMLSYRLACEDAKVEMIRHEVPFHTGVP
jgi:hypothetical protein